MYKCDLIGCEFVISKFDPNVEWCVHCQRTRPIRRAACEDILHILRCVAEGDEYARLYKWVNPDALFVEKVLRDMQVSKAGDQTTSLHWRILISMSVGANIGSILWLIFGSR